MVEYVGKLLKLLIFLTIDNLPLLTQSVPTFPPKIRKIHYLWTFKYTFVSKGMTFMNYYIHNHDGSVWSSEHRFMYYVLVPYATWKNLLHHSECNNMTLICQITRIKLHFALPPTFYGSKMHLESVISLLQTVGLFLRLHMKQIWDDFIPNMTFHLNFPCGRHAQTTGSKM